MKSIILLLSGLLVLAAALPAEAQITTEVAISGLNSPVRLVAPTGDDRLFVVQKEGRIRVFNQDGSERGVFLDIRQMISSGGERGLLGLAFAPDYGTSGRFYINYTDNSGDTRIARYEVSADPDVADAASAEIILTVDQPYANHNGGHLAFGPDGMLYIGLGDGGDGGDPQGNGQGTQTLLGKMLRLDVSAAAGYAIPPDNPFIGQAPLDEIWALGLRNPWCFDFDNLTGDLYIGDVGQARREEIDVQPASSSGGENYGWNIMEGTECFESDPPCNDGSLTLPVYDYARGGSPFRCSVTGGYVYRGQAIPQLAGHFFFADYCSKEIWTLTWKASSGLGPVNDWTSALTPPGGYRDLASFGEDGHGELYVLDLDGGTVYRIVPDPSAVPEVPGQGLLRQNVPNPFNPETTIAWRALADDAHVSLRIYDAQGRLVRTLVDGFRARGDHTATWNGTDAHGARVPSGVYLYRLEQGREIVSRKMLLLE